MTTSRLPDKNVGSVFSYSLDFLSEHLGVLLVYIFCFTILNTLTVYSKVISQGSIIKSLVVLIIGFYIVTVTAIMTIKLVDCLFNQVPFNIAGLLDHAHSRFWRVTVFGMMAGLMIFIPIMIIGVIIGLVNNVVIKIILLVSFGLPTLYIFAFVAFVRIMPVVEDLDESDISFGSCLEIAKSDMVYTIMMVFIVLLISVPSSIVVHVGSKIGMGLELQYVVKALLTVVTTMFSTVFTYYSYKVLKSEMDRANSEENFIEN